MFNCCHLPSDPLIIIIGRQTELAEVASERENIVKKLCRSLAFSASSTIKLFQWSNSLSNITQWRKGSENNKKKIRCYLDFPEWRICCFFNCKNIENCLKPWSDLLRCWRCSSHWNISRSQILATKFQSQSKSCNDKCGECVILCVNVWYLVNYVI